METRQKEAPILAIQIAWALVLAAKRSNISIPLEVTAPTRLQALIGLVAKELVTLTAAPIRRDAGYSLEQVEEILSELPTQTRGKKNLIWVENTIAIQAYQLLEQYGGRIPRV